MLDEKTFLEQAQNGVVMAALGKDRKVEGLITFLRISKGEEELKTSTYRKLTDNFTLKNNETEGDTIVCVSVCSAAYVPPSQIPQKGDTSAPTQKEMQEYLESGKDLTYNFHKKPKGGMLGAELVSLIPEGRPEDPFALGYNMLMSYPLRDAKSAIHPNANSSVAVQVIEAAMSIAQSLGVQKLYVYSRPAGAFQYFSKQ